MSDLPLDFKELLEEFDRATVESVIVGGYAVASHGRPRATKYIDIVLEGSVPNRKKAAGALDTFGAPPTVIEAVVAMKDSEVAFLGQPLLRVDLLRTIDGVPTEKLFAGAVDARLDGVRVRVISLDDLITNKKAAARPQDLIDAAFLEWVRDGRARTPDS